MKTSFRKSFARDLKKVRDRTILERVAQVIERVEAAVDLGAIGEVEKISGTDQCFRIRVGDFRLGVVVEGEFVEFVRCLPQRDIYRSFPRGPGSERVSFSRAPHRLARVQKAAPSGSPN